MDGPISPPPVTGDAPGDLPAYLANGVIGLRVRANPLTAGMTLLSGFAGEHPVRRIEAAAIAPYPLAADLRLNGVWMSEAPQGVRIAEQAYDFATAELTTRLVFEVSGCTAEIEVLSFLSREHPTIACQEIAVRLNSAGEMALRAEVDVRGVPGRALRHHRDTPGEAEPSCDGYLLWESAGALSTCGVAYVTELLGEEDASPDRPPMDGSGLKSEYAWRPTAGRPYRLRQIVSLIPSAMHRQPDQEAARLVALAGDIGFDQLRKGNRAVWADMWNGRIRLVGAEERWQAMADAAFYYLVSSTHVSSPASTSIFGLATWHDYHYYYGHVMWDIETFCVPPLSVLQPGAAESLLDYRTRTLEAAPAHQAGVAMGGLKRPGAVVQQALGRPRLQHRERRDAERLDVPHHVPIVVVIVMPSREAEDRGRSRRRDVGGAHQIVEGGVRHRLPALIGADKSDPPVPQVRPDGPVALAQLVEADIPG